ncbi:hypothetical protein CDIK_1304 [Cucumispora dikerogammari]|nr:hypothetical protein CDIK_1304 [Cucumispora dikerogammari]
MTIKVDNCAPNEIIDKLIWLRKYETTSFDLKPYKKGYNDQRDKIKIIPPTETQDRFKIDAVENKLTYKKSNYSIYYGVYIKTLDATQLYTKKAVLVEINKLRRVLK